MKQTSFKTNCGFLLSKLDSRFYGSEYRWPDKKIKKFLEDNFNSGVKVTLKLTKTARKKHAH